MSTGEGRRRTAPVGLWSSEKLDLLRCYLGGEAARGGFLPATLRAGQRFYVDLFAGAGQNRVEETDQIIDGSPLIALKAGPPAFTHVFWVEANSRNVASLEAHRDEYPSRRITGYAGDANERVDNVLHVLPRHYPAFAFLDPRGGELDWRTVVKLAQHKPGGEKKIELFILFAYNQGIVRLMPLDPSKMTKENEAGAGSRHARHRRMAPRLSGSNDGIVGSARSTSGDARRVCPRTEIPWLRFCARASLDQHAERPPVVLHDLRK